MTQIGLWPGCIPLWVGGWTNMSWAPEDLAEWHGMAQKFEKKYDLFATGTGIRVLSDLSARLGDLCRSVSICDEEHLGLWTMKCRRTTPFQGSSRVLDCPNSSCFIIEGSLEVKLPTIWRDEKAVSREKSQKRKDQKKEDAGARKGRKVAKHCVFSWFCGSGGLKSRLAKAAGAETSGEMRDEKLHAVVARSRFRSEKVQNTSGSDHFWKLRCWKSARRCGAKHIWK